jgi:hypothetical protein
LKNRIVNGEQLHTKSNYTIEVNPIIAVEASSQRCEGAEETCKLVLESDHGSKRFA